MDRNADAALRQEGVTAVANVTRGIGPGVEAEICPTSMGASRMSGPGRLGVVRCDLDVDFVDLGFLPVGEEDAGHSGNGGVLRADADAVIAGDRSQIERLKGEILASVRESLETLIERMTRDCEMGIAVTGDDKSPAGDRREFIRVSPSDPIPNRWFSRGIKPFEVFTCE